MQHRVLALMEPTTKTTAAARRTVPGRGIRVLRARRQA